MLPFFRAAAIMLLTASLCPADQIEKKASPPAMASPSWIWLDKKPKDDQNEAGGQGNRNGGVGKRDEILLANHGLRFLIVLVPDPDDSSMSHEFDLTLGAAQRAAESAQFVALRWSGMPGFLPSSEGSSPPGGSSSAFRLEVAMRCQRPTSPPAPLVMML